MLSHPVFFTTLKPKPPKNISSFCVPIFAGVPIFFVAHFLSKSFSAVWDFFVNFTSQIRIFCVPNFTFKFHFSGKRDLNFYTKLWSTSRHKNDTLIAGVFQLEYESIFKKDFFFSTSHKSRHSLAIIFIIVETTNCLVSKIATTTNWSKTKFNCPHPATAQKPKSRDGNLSVFA